MNLIDEIECRLIEKEDALMMANEIVENCNCYPIKRLLEYWVDYFV